MKSNRSTNSTIPSKRSATLQSTQMAGCGNVRVLMVSEALTQWRLFLMVIIAHWGTNVFISANEGNSVSASKDSQLEQWIQEVKAMPADQQVTAVAAKLAIFNAGFDGKITPKIQNGVVTEIMFASERVRDISPLQALTGLKVLRCNGKGSPLSDLSALRGMKLTLLDCIGTSVSDLTPLKGMPLRILNVNRTRVIDLSPVRGMPLTFFLCDETDVTDLTPLYDCKQLEKLSLWNITAKPDAVLELQKTFPNCSIKWRASTRATTPSAPPNKTNPFIDPSLKEWMHQVTQMTAEKQVEAVAAKMRELNPEFDGKLTPQIRNGVVSQLRISTNEVKNVSPLYALKKLEFLSCSGSPGKLENLVPLKGMPLSILFFNGTSVSDLSPLAGMQLTFLGMSRTKVSDLSPLKGMPLAFLICDGAPVTDLTPLHNCKTLKTLSLVDTQVTAEGVAALQKSLPKCEIKSQ